MQGNPAMVAVDFVAAVAGVWFFSAAIMGYSVRPLGALARLYYGVAGIFFVVPIEAFRAGRWMNIAAVCMVAALFVWERYLLRRARTAAA
jgi:TRAP-type uncharacterized transport system fused permease subunit